MKKKVISILLFFIMITLLVLVFSYDKKTYYSNQNDNNYSNISVMVYDEDEKDYIKQDSIPVGDYTLNTELSKCENNGEIQSYDSTIGKIYALLNGTDKCFLYFDIILPNLLVSQIVENTSSTHGGYSYQILNEGEGLRYEGRDPANYVCFYDTCTADELYRIIGVFNELVDTDNDGVADTSKKVIKLIKNKALSTAMAWDTGGSNIWSSSSLNTYLNNTWEKPTDDILTTRWYVGGYTTSDATTETLLSAESTGTSWDGKVGLMYVSDYGYGVLESNCARTTKMIKYTSCYTNDWLHYGSENISEQQSFSWFITPNPSYSNVAFRVSNAGAVGSSTWATVDGKKFGIKPVFYLDSSKTEIEGGTGTSSDPFLIVSDKKTVNITQPGTTTVNYKDSTWNITTNLYLCDVNGNNCIQSNTIPSSGYTLNNTSSCTKGSTIKYSDGNIFITSSEDDVCNLYLNKNDITLNITKTGITNANTTQNPWNINTTLKLCDATGNNCSSSSSFPSTGYYLDSTSSCTSGNINSYSSGGVNVTVTGGGTCNIILNNNGIIVNEGGGYRYEGKDPDNYVCFKSSCTDKELYRIIGTFDVMVDTNNDGTADTSKSAYKIIKYTKTTFKKWNDSSSDNTWETSSMNTYLNSTWTKPYNNILTARWNTSISKVRYSDGWVYISDGLADQYYAEETNFTTYWDGKIGLMYASDYGYGVVSTYCPRTTYLRQYSSSNCHNLNWVYSGGIDWMMVRINNTSAMYIHSDGSLSSITVNANSQDIRPVFYIDASTSFSSGNGSKTNPYIIQ